MDVWVSGLRVGRLVRDVCQSRWGKLGVEAFWGEVVFWWEGARGVWRRMEKRLRVEERRGNQQ